MGLVQDAARYIANAWNAVEEMGGEIPPNKNLANLPDGIASIPTGPLAPTLENLKKLLKKGTAQENFPVGTEIPDTWNGNDNPLIVAQYLDSTNNSAYGGAEGAILIRKYVDPTAQAFGTNVEYSTSTIKNFLDTTYLDNCTSSLKNAISSLAVPYNNTAVDSKWFLMSDTEVYAAGYDNVVEGIVWDYWKEKTGLSAPSNLNNTGRIMRDRNGTAQSVWLRSRYNIGNPCNVNGNGYISNIGPGTQYGVLPACFIGKD